MYKTNSKEKSNFYDLEIIKSIPIEDVCQSLGLPLERKGSRLWTKIRNENHSSTLLNRYEDTKNDKYANTFKDFGGDNSFGNVIDLVAISQNLDYKNSVELLADLFCIQPINDRDGLEYHELSNREYSFIGIYGDMVAKNLTLSSELTNIELSNIADKYSMSVNEFRKSNIKEDKELYESIIKNVSIYRLQKMRSSYYMSIWNEYSFLKGIHALEMFENVCSEKYFQELKSNIEKTETYINKAIIGTHLKKIKTQDYSPNNILENILAGKLKPQIGPYNYKEIHELAKQIDNSVKYRPVNYNQYIESKESLKSIPYSAFLDSGTVVIGYLKRDIKKIQEIYGPPNKLQQVKETSLNNIVSNAEKRKNNVIENYAAEFLEK